MTDQTDLGALDIGLEPRHYCDRCRATIPVEEWRLWVVGELWYWRHIGEQRGIVQWDGPDDDRMCGFLVRVPERV